MLVDPKVQDRRPGPPGRIRMQLHGIAAPQQIHHGKQRTCLSGGIDPGDWYAVCPTIPYKELSHIPFKGRLVGYVTVSSQPGNYMIFEYI